MAANRWRPVTTISVMAMALMALMLNTGLAHATNRATTSVTIRVLEYTYDPKTTTIDIGSTVTWRNIGKEAHTATFVGVFDTGNIAPGREASWTFTQPGTFRYVCRIHGGPTGEGMNGTVIVTGGPAEEPSQPTPTPAAPKPEPPSPTVPSPTPEPSPPAPTPGATATDTSLQTSIGMQALPDTGGLRAGWLAVLSTSCLVLSGLCLRLAAAPRRRGRRRRRTSSVIYLNL